MHPADDTRTPGLTLRVEIFPAELGPVVDFYSRVLGFSLVTDQQDGAGYVALRRGAVLIGAAARPGTRPEPSARRPPIGVELVLEVDDVVAERECVVAAGWPLEEDLVTRPWGLEDFRLLDPAGHYLRVTGRSRSDSWPPRS